MAVFPTPYTAHTRAFSEGPEKDPRGSLVKKWATPVAQRLIAIGPKTVETEPVKPGYDRVVIKRDLYAPPGFVAGPQDKVLLPGEPEYIVVGYPEDFSGGPWGFNPGLVVHVTRTEG
ncbi:hypothetical protein ACWDYH_00265 [Nocardia goodfellowii]